MLETIISTIGIFLVYSQLERFKKNEKTNIALEAILKALEETTNYLERTKNSESNRTEELRLSNLWEMAALRMSEIDKELSKKLNEKGKYWKSDIRLSRKEILANGIALWQVKEKYDLLINAKRK